MYIVNHYCGCILQCQFPSIWANMFQYWYCLLQNKTNEENRFSVLHLTNDIEYKQTYLLYTHLKPAPQCWVHTRGRTCRRRRGSPIWRSSWRRISPSWRGIPTTLMVAPMGWWWPGGLVARWGLSIVLMGLVTIVTTCRRWGWGRILKIKNESHVYLIN